MGYKISEKAAEEVYKIFGVGDGKLMPTGEMESIDKVSVVDNNGVYEEKRESISVQKMKPLDNDFKANDEDFKRWVKFFDVLVEMICNFDVGVDNLPMKIKTNSLTVEATKVAVTVDGEVSVDSASSVNITATGAIVVDSESNVDINASGNLAIRGTNVGIN